MKRCKYGKLKSPRGRRVCKRRAGSGRARRSGHRKGRARSFVRRHARKAGAGVGLLAVAAIGAVGAYSYWSSQGA